MRLTHHMLKSYSFLPSLKIAAGQAVALPTLKFSLDEGLSEVFSKRQLELHIHKHHQGYIDKINGFLKTHPAEKYGGMEIEEIARSLQNGGMFNQFAQHLNHSFYWSCLKSGGGALQSPHSVEKAINRTFGSFGAFQAQFNEAGLGNFGSGWTWLVADGDKLKIVNTSNAELPAETEGRAILTIDVWEHAYYKDFENRRADYLKEIWKVVDWPAVSENYDRAMST
ncbi:iron-containing superoxide dismutase A [Perkinsela sp. CCAP 1560/4]|nr:iron-containing superoxide dismutase A [Perkinsela sp. CCAP 1560/4]|eukprot:KNH05894.1 iron-containing superoxide dismutase A [Perkinsela sp. CCAP 1560/4]